MSKIDQKATHEIWRRLLRSESFATLGLPLIDGRVDLRELRAPEPTVVREFATEFAHVRELGGVIELRRVRLDGLDFSGAKLAGLRWMDSTITNCRFDGADCSGWRMWAMNVLDSTFRRAKLRDVSVGGTHDGR